jgi:hypothetical protein
MSWFNIELMRIPKLTYNAIKYDHVINTKFSSLLAVINVFRRTNCEIRKVFSPFPTEFFVLRSSWKSNPSTLIKTNLLLVISWRYYLEESNSKKITMSLMERTINKFTSLLMLYMNWNIPFILSFLKWHFLCQIVYWLWISSLRWINRMIGVQTSTLCMYNTTSPTELNSRRLKMTFLFLS